MKYYQRVFRRPNIPGTWFVSVQMSFTSKRDAEQVARAIDQLKAHAGREGGTLSDALHAAITGEAERISEH